MVGWCVAVGCYLGRFVGPVRSAVDIYSRLNRLNSSLRRILKIIDEKPSVCESPTAVELPRRTQAGVILEGVLFGYRDNQHVLTGLNLEIRTGEKIALVGCSGSGKSTVAKLLAKLYDVNQGVVRIDGMYVRDATLASLRSTVCYVPQEAILFDRSLKQTFLLAKP